MKRTLRLSPAIIISATLLLVLFLGAGDTDVHAQQEGTAAPTPAASPQPESSRNDEQVPYVEETHPPKYDNMTSLLNGIVTQYEAGALTARAAASTAPLHSEESVAVTFHIEEAHVQGVWDYLQANDVSARKPLEDEHFIEAEVPVSLLAEASQQPGVIRVIPITPNQPAQGTIGGQGATAHGADAWHDAGFKGQGVKIGVIDVGFAGFADLQGTELPSTVQMKCADGTTLSDCAGSGKHGTGVTEILYDVAPDATYYIYSASTKGDWKSAVAWMVEQGVDVINASISREWDGPGNGTSPYTDSPLKAVDSAVTGGSVFVTSAGNEGQSTWYGSFADTDNDNVMEFASGDECNGVELVADKTFIAQLRWNDTWSGSNKDLDLYLRPVRNGSVGLEVARGSDWQDGDSGDVPHETVYYTPSSDGTYCLGVQRKTSSTGALPSWVQVQSYIGPGLEHSTTSHGITNPAETKNPGALAVGAAHWNDTATIYTLSSRGPLPDGTIKPDIVGAHFVETSTYEDNSSGTSFASPHVAGLAALVKQVDSSRSPSDIATYLKDNAQGRDTVPNNTWGYGFAQLPAPPSTDAALSALTLSDVDIGTFSPETTSYSASVGKDTSQTTVTPTVNDSNASYVIRIGGAADADGTVILALGENVITVEVTAEDDETTKTYTVTVTRAADPCGGSILADTTIEGGWDDTCLSEKDAPGGEGDRYARFYSFTLAEAADVVISLSSNEDTYLYLLDGHGKDGDTLHQNDDIGAGNLDSHLSVTLQAGNYTIEATTYDAEAEGDFTLTIEGIPEEQEPEVAPEPEAEPCEKAITADGTIEGSWDDTCVSEKDAISGTGDRYARFYTFTLDAAADVTISLESEEDTYLYVLEGHGKGGDTRHENDDIQAGVNLNSQISENLSAGDYTIEATTYYAETSGDFTLEVEGLGEGNTTTAPDLEVGMPSVDDANPATGATFTLSATVTNSGDGESSATTLSYYRSTNAIISGADTEVGTDTVEALAATATSDRSIELTAPSTAGTYYYGACVDAVTGESDSTDNCSAAVTVPVLQTQQQIQGAPDLDVGAPSVDDASPETGGTFTLSATVTNSGDKESAATTLRYYQSTDSTISSEDAEVGTDAVGVMAASGTSEQSIDLTAPSMTGTYYYGACVDAVTDESDTTDNCSAAVRVDVREPTTGPDLEVETPSVDDASPETGATFTLSATVTNAGDEESVATILRYYKSTDSRITMSDTEVGTDAVGALAASGTSDQSIDLTAPSTAGTYYYGACVDSVTDESDTTDNCSPPVKVIVVEAQQQPQGSPDLEVGTPSVDDNSPQPGAKFTLSATVTNAGDGESASTTLRYYRSTDSAITASDTEVGTDAVGALVADGTSAESVSLTAPSTAGTYYYGACVDSVTDESDTTDNCSASVTVNVEEATVTPPPRTPPPRTTFPDLAVGTPSVDNDSPTAGSAFTLSATVTNAGDGASAATTLRYYRSADSTITTSDTQVGTDSVGALAAAGTSAESISLTAPSAAGTYYYGACVDSVTGESDTTDNCSSSVEVTVLETQQQTQGSPDLVVGKPGRDIRVRPGATFTLSPTVRNIGDAESSATTLRYYSRYSGREEYGQVPMGQDTEEGTDTIAPLAPGGESSQSMELTAPTTLGDYQGAYFYGACVDRVAGEPATTNNCSNGIEVRVTFRPELTVSASAPARVRPGAWFHLSATVTNEGDAAASRSSGITITYYQSEDSTITTSDTDLSGRINVGSEIAAGTSETDDPGEYLRAPSTPGTYYYGACIASGSIEREWDTTNNCSEAVAVLVKGRPNLTIRGGFGLQCQTPCVPGGSFSLSARLENEGDGPSDATTVQFYQSADDTITTSDTQVATAAVDALAPGEIKHYRSGDLTNPSTPGSYYYGACVDAVPDESDTSDHCTSSLTLTVAEPAPDLRVGAKLSIVHSTLAPGTPVTLSARVFNVGSEDAEATTLRFYQSDDGQTISSADTLLGTEEIGALESADNSEHTIDITAPLAPGSYHFGACVDTVTDELVTDNNCSFGRWMGVSAPDLTVGTPTVNEASPATGATFTLSATVTNSGGRDAAATTLRYYRSTDSTITSDDTEVGTDDIAALESRDDSDQSISLTAPSAAGTYYYGACVDTVTYEYDTADNCSASVTVVATAPNLQVGTPSADNASPAAGATFKLSATVSNAGDRGSAATTLRYYESTDSTISSADTEVGTDSVGALTASGTSDQSIDLTAPTDTGTYYYGACVDSLIDESDTTDNCSGSVQVDIQ